MTTQISRQGHSSLFECIDAYPSNNPTVKQRCNRVGHIVGMTLESNLGTLLFFGIVGATLSSDVAPLLVY